MATAVGSRCLLRGPAPAVPNDRSCRIAGVAQLHTHAQLGIFHRCLMTTMITRTRPRHSVRKRAERRLFAPAGRCWPVVQARRLSIRRWPAASRCSTPGRSHRAFCCPLVMSTMTCAFVVFTVPVRLLTWAHDRQVPSRDIPRSQVRRPTSAGLRGVSATRTGSCRARARRSGASLRAAC
jgi:hypothetical protein